MKNELYGENLKAAREKKGWSREDLASKMGVSYSTVLRWETSKHKPMKFLQNVLEKLLR
ncbi:MAG: helix-turn-helix domain-containing protein [Elusimicrobia bacterium]|nr:helix-turn-helix domain-containing protein [Elusimicrobiota bacterium]